jgi:hypothetical protein
MDQLPTHLVVGHPRDEDPNPGRSRSFTHCRHWSDLGPPRGLGSKPRGPESRNTGLIAGSACAGTGVPRRMRRNRRVCNAHGQDLRCCLSIRDLSPSVNLVRRPKTASGEWVERDIVPRNPAHESRGLASSAARSTEVIW